MRPVVAGIDLARPWTYYWLVAALGFATVYLLWRFHDAPSAEQYFRRAIALGATEHNLTDDEEESWENAYRWLYIQYHSRGQHREAQDIARAAMHRFPQTLYFRGALMRDEAAARRHS